MNESKVHDMGPCSYRNCNGVITRGLSLDGIIRGVIDQG